MSRLKRFSTELDPHVTCIVQKMRISHAHPYVTTALGALDGQEIPAVNGLNAEALFERNQMKAAARPNCPLAS